MTAPTHRSGVFCDFFRITTPKDLQEEVLASVVPHLQDMGCTGSEGAYKLPDSNGYFIWGVRHKVCVYQFTGQMAEALRANGALSRVLAEFSLFPHRVTGVDVTCDEYVSAPERLHEAYKAASRGDVSFTRKAIPKSAVSQFFRPILYDYGGLLQDTGTVYVGRRGSHEVHAKLYDKRNQLLAEKGLEVRDTLRHELTVSGKMGITLRDIVQPEALFYHFYPDVLLARGDVPVWTGGAEGYELDKGVALLPAQRLKRRVEVSSDLEGMFRLVSEVGEGGLPLLLRLIERRYQPHAEPLNLKALTV